jgi:hypothetical protein
MSDKSTNGKRSHAADAEESGNEAKPDKPLAEAPFTADGPYTPVELVYWDTCPGGAKTMWVSGAVFDLLLLRLPAANDGDRQAARALLEWFISAPYDATQRFSVDFPARNSAVTEYVADCIRRWLAVDCHERRARSAFNLVGPAHRERSNVTEEKNIKAIANYLKGRGNGLSRADAIEKAASAGRLGVDSVHVLIRGINGRSGVFTDLQRRAINELKYKAMYGLADSDIVHRSLGRAFARWEKLEAKRQAILLSTKKK